MKDNLSTIHSLHQTDAALDKFCNDKNRVMKIKLSEAQKKVLSHLRENEKIGITQMHGLVSYCFFSPTNFRAPKLTLPTMFKLKDLKLIDRTKDDWRSTEYQLTELGKTIKL